MPFSWAKFSWYRRWIRFRGGRTWVMTDGWGHITLRGRGSNSIASDQFGSEWIEEGCG